MLFTVCPVYIAYLLLAGPRLCAASAEVHHKTSKRAVLAGNRRDNETVLLNTAKRMLYGGCNSGPKAARRAAPHPPLGGSRHSSSGREEAAPSPGQHAFAVAMD